jgi:prepilin-type N-terminal cleavage/methylation domain-containing protein
VNSRGFNLLEVVVALLLMGVAATGVLAVSQVLQSSQEPDLQTGAALETLLEASPATIAACPNHTSILLGNHTFSVCRESIVQNGLGYTRMVTTLRSGPYHLTRIRVTNP